MLKKHLIIPACVLTTAIVAVAPIPAQFSTTYPANPAVLRMGDGTAATSGQAKPVQIQTYIGNSTLQASPTSFVDFDSVGTAGSPNSSTLTISGTATSEGNLTNSVDLTLITLTGYKAINNTANVISAVANADRLVGTVSVTGINQIGNPTVAASQTQANAYSANNMRSAVTDNGTNYWTGGTATSNGGARLFNSSTSVGVSGSATNIRSVDIYGGQLFGTNSSGSGGSGVNAMGSGLPTAGPGASTPYIVTSPAGATGSAVASPYEFVITNTDKIGSSVTVDGLGLGIAYISDDRSSINGGGVQKWAFNGTTWVLQYTFTTISGGGDLAGARGLAGYYDSVLGANVLYVTNAAANSLFEIVDTGSTATFDLLASSGTNFAFRGVALIAVPEPGTYALLGMTGMVGAGVWFQRRRSTQSARFVRSSSC